MSDFHFIRPLWLLAIVGLFFVIYLLKKMRVSQSGWQQLLPKHLANVLIEGSQSGKQHSLALPFIIGFLTIVALAGPSWQKLPQPVYQLERGSVLIMDMSYSMLSTDLTPNRLTRARYKATDLLDNLNEGEIGLIAYAGDAFVISPLTDDINNIKLLLPSLTPDIMPELGSNPYAALTMAHEMLSNAGHIEGDIYWFTDGIDSEDVQDITEWSRETPHRLNILGIGTASGAPIKLANGELMKDNAGAIVIPKLPEQRLYGAAERGRGSYRTISNDFSDINALIKPPTATQEDKESEQFSTGDQWQEAGPYLLLLVLPLVLGYFRRGTLLAIVPLCLFLTPVEQAYASLWQDLWKTKDQQAQDKFNQEAYQEAAEQFENKLWQGSAHYKAGNYEQALEAFQQQDSAQALYNQGNTLAKLQKLDEAIEAYNKAIAKDPQLQDAKDNKALLEQLKQQQEQQEQQNQDNQQNNQEQNQDQSQEQEQSGDQQQSQNESEQQQQNEQGQESSSEQGQQDSQQSDSQSDSSDQPSDSDKQQEQGQQEQQQGEEQQEQQAQASEQQEKSPEEGSQQQQAQLAQDKLDQETEQKHQQLLNKVTDDPYLLLRNKMQIEYQKRRQNQTNLGVKKKW